MRTYSGSPWQRLDPELREALAPIDRFLREVSPAFARIAAGRAPEGTGATIGRPVQGVAAENTSMPHYLYLPDPEGTVQTVEGDIIFAGTVNFSSSAITSVIDDLFYIVDASDTTKQATFSCAAISTGTLRTYTFPDANGTLVLKDSANTFTRGLTIDNVFTDPGDVLLKLIPDASQSADILQVRNAADSASTLSVSSTGVLTAQDASFLIVDETDPTKTAKFSLGGASANADLTLAWAGTGDRTVTVPDATTTLAGLAVSQTFTKGQVIDNDTASDVLLKLVPHASQTADPLQVRNSGDTDNHVSIGASGILTLGSSTNAQGMLIHTDTSGGAADVLFFEDAASGFIGSFAVSGFTASRQLIFPDISGNLLTSNGVALTTFQLRSSTSSTGASFRDQTTNSKQLRFVLSGAVGNNAIVVSSTAGRTYTLPDVSANILTDSTGIALLGSAAIDMQTAATTTIFTTQTGKVTRITHAVVRDATASLAGGTSYTITGLRATFSLAALTTANTGLIVVRAADLTEQLEVAASTAVQLTVTTGSTAAATATIDVFGYAV